jgi:hypothetical protein
MPDTPLGAPGDVVPRGEGHAPSPQVHAPDVLRHIAGWLEAHPHASISTVDLIGLPYGDVVKVYDFGAGSAAAMHARASLVGGEFEQADTERMWQLRQPIMPGVEFWISTSKPETCPVPEDETDVPW